MRAQARYFMQIFDIKYIINNAISMNIKRLEKIDEKLLSCLIFKNC